MPSFAFTTNLPLPRTPQELQDRIRELFFIRTELEREIETLMGVKAEAAKTYHCVRCDYRWKSRLAHRPKMCPSCRIKKFDSPPLYTYEEKIARKKEMLARAQAAPKDPPEIVIPQAPMAHSVLTRQVSSEADSIQNVALTPPPAAPMSLRERLAQMKSQVSDDTVQHGGERAGEIASIRKNSGHGLPPEDRRGFDSPAVSTSLSDDELLEAINGEDDAT